MSRFYNRDDLASLVGHSDLNGGYSIKGCREMVHRKLHPTRRSDMLSKYCSPQGKLSLASLLDCAFSVCMIVIKLATLKM